MARPEAVSQARPPFSLLRGFPGITEDFRQREIDLNVGLYFESIHCMPLAMVAVSEVGRRFLVCSLFAWHFSYPWSPPPSAA